MDLLGLWVAGVHTQERDQPLRIHVASFYHLLGQQVPPRSLGTLQRQQDRPPDPFAIHAVDQLVHRERRPLWVTLAIEPSHVRVYVDHRSSL